MPKTTMEIVKELVEPVNLSHPQSMLDAIDREENKVWYSEEEVNVFYNFLKHTNLYSVFELYKQSLENKKRE